MQREVYIHNYLCSCVAARVLTHHGEDPRGNPWRDAHGVFTVVDPAIASYVFILDIDGEVASPYRMETPLSQLLLWEVADKSKYKTKSKVLVCIIITITLSAMGLGMRLIILGLRKHGCYLCSVYGGYVPWYIYTQ